LSDLPDCAILASKNGRVLEANDLALQRFGEQVAMGAFAPWY
jgi:hypothetical protein